MTDCRFCKDYKWWRKRSRKDNEKHNKDPDRTFNLRSYFEVTIVERTFCYRGNPYFRKYVNRAGTMMRGRYPINYCPVCGRRVK